MRCGGVKSWASPTPTSSSLTQTSPCVAPPAPPLPAGYLQRCLVKNLESLKVHYDSTVRDDCDSSILQVGAAAWTLCIRGFAFRGPRLSHA